VQNAFSYVQTLKSILVYSYKQNETENKMQITNTATPNSEYLKANGYRGDERVAGNFYLGTASEKSIVKDMKSFQKDFGAIDRIVIESAESLPF